MNHILGVGKMVPLSLIIALAACGHTPTPEPVIVTRTVNVPVAVACIPDNLGPAPTYPDTDAAIRAAADAVARYALIAAGRLLRIQRASETEPVIEQCRSAGTSPH